MRLPLFSIPIETEEDVVLARQRAREVAAAVGFELQDQTRIATAVSEIARNAYSYASNGIAEFSVNGTTAPQVLVITVRDRGHGIAALDEVLEGRYRSSTGMGLGIIGARRLVDGFEITSNSGGTTVVMSKLLPRRVGFLAPQYLTGVAQNLLRDRRQTPLQELRQQNLELVSALDALRARQDELVSINRELEDTNRGVVALYAELDEKAEHLRRADQMKSKFLSNMTHEFRTPLNSIRALSRILLDQTDGPLNEEQRTQVAYVQKAALDLAEIVDDLLDIAKIEAGKVTVRPSDFSVEDLFSALRGMLRPLLIEQSVALVFEEPGGLPRMYTDEAKVSQILRNFISNALKFTETGEVRVSARLDGTADRVIFSVSDTGIGIAPEDREVIFQEFSQVESSLQHRVKGTGLGLPLTKRLAEILGGDIEMESEVGVGSTFRAVIPRVYAPRPASVTIDLFPDDPRIPVLFVEDHLETMLIYEKYLQGSPFRPLVARSIREAREILNSVRPRVAVLDIVLAGEDIWEFLAELRREAGTRQIPIAIISQVEDQHKAAALGVSAYQIKPVTREWLLDTLTALARPRSALVIDDDDAARYILRRALSDANCATLEAATGAEGLLRARSEQPDLIFLDLQLPDISGLELLSRLQADASTASIPVIINTSRPVDESLTQAVGSSAVLILSKQQYDRDALVATIRQVFADQGR